MPAGAPPVYIVLMGLRGSGKSSVGRLLAERLGLPFIDLDDLTPRRMGFASVAEAWERAGQQAFRAAEFDALGELLSAPAGPAVIALGGGTPTAPGAADLLRDARCRGLARVVYLSATASVLRERLGSADNAHRPSLTGKGVVQEVEAVLAARQPLYTALADLVLDVDSLSVEAAADRIESWVRAGG